MFVNSFIVRIIHIYFLKSFNDINKSFLTNLINFLPFILNIWFGFVPFALGLDSFVIFLLFVLYQIGRVI